MSYIIRAGRLAGPADLKADQQGTLTAHATIIVNDRARDPDTGEWFDAATTAYRLTLRGRAAQRLADFQSLNGNKQVIFAGNYKVRTYTAPDGTTRLSHDVWVDHIGVDLAAHDLQIITPTPQPVVGSEDVQGPAAIGGAPEGENPWSEDTPDTENPF
jgi:single-stranded DNA-binding protein